MFDFVSKHKRLIMIVFLILIVPPFAFFGMESYTRSMSNKDELASVDGTPISQREFEGELRQQQDRLRAVLGRNFDLAAFDSAEARSGLLDSMVAQRLIAGEAVRSHLLVSDEALRDAISGMAAFQVGGKFSRSNYEALLRAQGMTPASFESRLRYDLSVGQLSRAIGETAMQPQAVVARVIGLEEQRREVSEAVVSFQPFLGQVTLDEARLKAHYEANLAEFRIPERLRAEYLVLSAEELAKREPAGETALKALYDSRADRYKVDEQRRASHILILAAADAKDAARQAARRKAEEVLAEARKSPARFAELAKKHSQDPGSAEKGGDLGYFGRGMLVKAFEDAAYRMRDGEISDVVETEFGYHVIRVTGIQAAKTRPLEEVRGELLAELGKQTGAKRFAEAAEGFSNLVYEQADSLKPAADQYKLALRTTEWLTNTPSREMGMLGNQKLLNALFSAESVRTKRNTDAVEVAPSVLVAARVIAHEPAAQRKFEEVRAEIEQRLRRGEAAKLAQQEGAAKLAALQKGGEAAGVKWSAPRLVSRREPQGVPLDALRRLLAADASRLPAHVGIDRSDDGYVLYRVTKVVEPGPKADAAGKADLARIERQAGAEQFNAYIASLRSKAKIEINKAAIEKKSGG